MLTQLHIKNFALIDDLTLNFSDNLNVLTGETGAGKSILIDAIRFVLGARLEIDKDSADKKIAAEAAFELSEETAENPLFENYLQDDFTLILRREYADGKSRAWVNSRLAAVSQLKEIGMGLIDIHGQHDHQRLFQANAHLGILDRFAQIDITKTEYPKLFSQYEVLLKSQKELNEMEASREREIDLLKYQIDEIENADILKVDEIEMETERIRLANSEKLSELTAGALGALDENEQNADLFLSHAIKNLKGLAKFDESINEIQSESEQIQYSLQEIILKLKDYREKLTFDPERFAELEKKKDLLEHLKKKYGTTLEKVKEFYADAKKRYEQLIDLDMAKSDLGEEIENKKKELKRTAEKFTAKRKESAARLENDIEKELKDLQIAKAEIKIKITNTDFSENGADGVEFFARMNPGEPMLAIEKSISGGEASRIMLAIKKALIQTDPVSVLIFDEIDANIGGRLGRVTGEKLKSISEERQVLLVTHLPQIASFADRHFKVTKSVVKGKTKVYYEILEGQEKIDELAQMMSGQDTSEISTLHAEEMLARAKQK